jgi:(1->4)-alpha-D-glucan 1-alpha-D-glucosylmutase
MYIPSSTYRLQLHAGFHLTDAQSIVSYLQKMGISTLYASPCFRARKGSMHGYDVTNPHEINPEIGTWQGFEETIALLRQNDMGWLQDIVPNHMVFSMENPWMQDVLEKGPDSKYFPYFDINWEHFDPLYQGKVMIPSLGNAPEEVLKNQEIQLTLNASGLCFTYYDNYFPVSMASYHRILSPTLEKISGLEGATEYRTMIETLQHPHQLMQSDWQHFKKQLYAWVQQHLPLQEFIQSHLDAISQDMQTLQALLEEQHFRLAYWKDTEHIINYRRFFTVNDLICLNMNHKEVFEEYHRFIGELVEKNMVQGLRVDHIDGLLDPVNYLHMLRKFAGENTYLVVEKILEHDEILPADWPIQGTTGYDFLAIVNHLLTNSQQAEKLAAFYQTIHVQQYDYEELVYLKKMFILLHRMGGELDNLVHLAERLQLLSATIERDAFRQALSYLLASFPVYRIYSNQLPFSEYDKKIIGEAFALAESKASHLKEAFQHLRRIFDGKAEDNEAFNRNKLNFVMRCQQLTGPLAAKGAEDTAFYIYNWLISQSEVGSSPDEEQDVTISQFHLRMQNRPLHTMNTTATHDTKRGEDARARINVLTGLPEVWAQQISQWQQINQKHKTIGQSGWIPDTNDEYFIYQSLIGTYPLHIDAEVDNYPARFGDYMLKSIREAKVHTSWADPQEAYEKAVENFVRSILQDEAFLNAFLPFVKRIARLGAIYSLGQTLLKITAPGIPDMYQGCEYWDLSMVDPDNRRPVDYQDRIRKLEYLEKKFTDDPLGLVQQLTHNIEQPDIKMFLIWRALNERALYASVFREGTYTPVRVAGTHASHILSFLRQYQDEQVLIVVSLNIVDLLDEKQYLPIGEEVWQNTHLLLPDEQEASWHNVFTNEELQGQQGKLYLKEICRYFPVAFLKNQVS